MRQSENIHELAAALARAQGSMTHVGYNATNPAFKSRYATLAAVVEAAREPLTSNGLAFVQTINSAADGIWATTIILHASGQWIELEGPVVPVDKKNAHGAMSAATYAKRGALAAALCLAAEEDDDGNAAASAPAAKTTTVRELLQEEEELRAAIQRAKTLTQLKLVGSRIAAASDRIATDQLKQAYFDRREEIRAHDEQLKQEGEQS